MEYFIQLFVLIPFIGFNISLLMPSKKEGLISWSTVLITGLQLGLSLLFFIYWLYAGRPILELKSLVLFHRSDTEFYLDLLFDKITAAYLLVGAILSFLVSIYSKSYLHREPGYKRYFNTILFFYLGYNLTIFSGNLETLFIGWEILGISSFLLIAFYRDRYLPVKNAVKIFSIYRIGDVGILLGIWMSHHLFHESITFLRMQNYELIHDHLLTHSWVGVFISFMILLSAAAKSAQLPFSSWLPRAMEGPTPSSAIFYGSLSVHIGVFILLRTYPFWDQQYSVRFLIGILGISTTIITTGIARVQSSIKSQIAYASIAQIGLMFVEVALGFRDLALFHFAANAFLRTYQLLVSPSVVTYLIREQFYNFSSAEKSIEDRYPNRLQYTLYILCLKEWNLDTLMYTYLWNPLKWAGKKLDFLNLNRVLLFFIPLYALGVVALQNRDKLPAAILPYLPELFAFIALIVVLKSFTERKRVLVSWVLVIINHCWIALAVSFNEKFTYQDIVIYLSGIILSGAIGYLCLYWLQNQERNIDLDRFHGHSYEYPRTAIVFFISCLGVTGFPITPTFIGEDLIFGHIQENQFFLAAFVSLSFIIDGLAIIRIYARVFLGPHAKTYHEIAYRSS